MPFVICKKYIISELLCKFNSIVFYVSGHSVSFSELFYTIIASQFLFAHLYYIIFYAELLLSSIRVSQFFLLAVIILDFTLCTDLVTGSVT